MNSKNVQDLFKYGINKQIINFKEPSSEGLVLMLYHGIQDSKNKTQVIRFIQAAFNSEGTILAAANQNGSIFIIDFISNKSWCIPNLLSCTVLKFSTYHTNEVLVGLNHGLIQIINIEDGSNRGQLQGHKHSVHELSFANGAPLCISSSAYESIIWNLEKNVKVQVLSLEEENALKHVLYMPVTNDILACFNDDTIYVWKYNTFETFKQISPSAWNKLPLKTIAFTKNGRAMVLGGYSSNLYTFILDTWSFAKTIILPNCIQAVKKLSFISQPFDGGCNKILCILACNGILYFFDMEKSHIISKLPTKEEIIRFICSADGKRIACVTSLGEIKIYNLMQYIKESKAAIETADNDKPNYTAGPIKPRKSSSSVEIQKQIDKLLELEKLRAMLKEFGQFPDMFRLKIWTCVLQLPNNRHQYNSLINYSPQLQTMEEFDRKCTLENKCMQMGLKRLISNLVTWCPFLGFVDFLPQLVFPFLKIFNNDPLVCFEVVCTVIINWCQHWFEYYPLPPLNILALIENLLVEHDPELLNFFTKMEVTSKTYALPLLQSALSEILTSADWCILWDHILTNEPSFLLMVVAAYNIMNRCVLAKFKDLNDFEFFFTNPNPIDIKKLVGKSYSLLYSTMSHNHPRQFLKTFKSLEIGPYPQYMDYPKIVFDLGNSATDLKREKKILEDDEEKLSKLQKANEKEFLENLTIRDEEVKRTEEMQQLYYNRLKEEYERINDERKKVAELRKAVSQQQTFTLNLTREALSQQENRKRQAKIECLLNNLDFNTKINKAQIEESQLELLNHYTELLKHKLRIEELLNNDDDMKSLTSEYDIVKQHQVELAKELRKACQAGNSTAHLKQLNIATGISAIDKLIKKIENELSKSVSSHTNVKSLMNNNKVLKLQTETKELELEIQKLLQKLAGSNVSEKDICSKERLSSIKLIAPTNSPHS